MNIKSLYNIVTGILLPLTVIAPWLASCSGDTPADPASQPRSLRFTADGITVGSRVAHDGYKSTFDNGDLIGCVIIDTSKEGDEQYMANSCWQYNTDGYLVLTKLFGQKDYTPNAQLDIQSNDIITRDDSKESGEWVKLTDGNAAYKFLFYYPYTGMDEIHAELESANDISDITYPNIITKLDGRDQNFIKNNYISLPVGKPDGDYDFSVAKWTDYPTFVNINQSSKAHINRSEFMTASTTATSGTITLKFLKRIAEIEVDCDVALGDLFFQNQNSGLTRGRAYDFSKEGFTSITYIDSWAFPVFRREPSVIIKESFTPCPEDDSNTRFRLILPAQTDFDCDMHFTIGDKSYTIALEQNITELKENHLYIIHINKAGECTLRINDWQDDGSGLIVDKDETN